MQINVAFVEQVSSYKNNKMIQRGSLGYNNWRVGKGKRKTRHFWLHNQTNSHFVYEIVLLFTFQIYFLTMIQNHPK